MKIIKINKSYRNGTKEHFLVLLEELYTTDDIDYLVEDWCESEGSGMNYGYTYESQFVKDDKLINTILKDKIKTAEREIETLKLKSVNMKENIINGFNKNSKLNISDVRSSDVAITLTKGELETFLQDWEQGCGSWSDTSRRIVRFLRTDETDGL